MKHSTIVGGSTAKRVITCPGSVALCAKMPPKPSSTYADEGTLLHTVISEVLNDDDKPIHEYLGQTYEQQVLTAELVDAKLLPALTCLDEIDPNKEMEFALEVSVDFGKFLPGVFGSCDLLGRMGSKAIVLDWKFGSGVAVPAEENAQLMFYAAAAMRTEEAKWVFESCESIELIIVQIDQISRWTTTPARIAKFEKQLKSAVKASKQIDAKLQHGDHCRWCAAKPICPLMRGAVDRAVQTQIAGLNKSQISGYLKNADILEGWISDLRALAMQVMESGEKIPDWKLVAKRSVRKWVDEEKAASVLNMMGVPIPEIYKPQEIKSPAQAEKMLKPLKKELPFELVTSVSSGNTFAPASDPRPEVVQIGQQLTAALSKVVV